MQKLGKIAVCIGTIEDVHIQKQNDQLTHLRKNMYKEVRSKYNIETLKGDPTVRAYRDLYWKLDIDPTKTRPSGEALLRRVLHGDNLPQISTVIDAYNLVSAKTLVPISGFDANRLSPPFSVRFATNGETFRGIGMNEATSLTEKMLILADEEQILCIYPYRDCEQAKISMNTRNVLIVCYGAVGIPEHQLNEAAEATLSYIKEVGEGEVKGPKIFRSSEQ